MLCWVLNKGVVKIECFIYWNCSWSTYASEMIPVTKEPAVKPAINNIIANVVSPFLSQTKLCCHRKNFIINSQYVENIMRKTLHVDYRVAKRGYETLIISHGREYETGQFHSRVHIFKSESWLASFWWQEMCTLVCNCLASHYWP
jgi:hypothetical protein